MTITVGGCIGLSANTMQVQWEEGKLTKYYFPE